MPSVERSPGTLTWSKAGLGVLLHDCSSRKFHRGQHLTSTNHAFSNTHVESDFDELWFGCNLGGDIQEGEEGDEEQWGGMLVQGANIGGIGSCFCGVGMRKGWG